MSEFPVSLPSKDRHLMTLSQEGPLFILHLHHKDNRFTTEFCQAILKALQIVEDYFLACEEPVDMALVTLGNDKIYSNGLDLMHAISYRPFMDVFLSLLKKLLTFCIPTVAAINGHAFAGGCMLALAHDYRVMRSDRGYMCMNEVDLPSPLTPGMSGLLRCKMSPITYRDMIIQGHRFTAQEALEQHLVDFICPNDQVLNKAKEIALKWAPKAKSGIVYKQLKDEVSTLNFKIFFYHYLKYDHYIDVQRHSSSFKRTLSSACS
ncbi:ClpP/crotonase-like domain-containing protein [Cokeromyces recurvatus]|uniref:ClpP/crotonase-like domain-containing protein n=1 Tax=Cokeromyces recurvatus TaxID=90255 RepID=UPI00221EE484|nr:ClpP/crotonase-like domain-containing protein [Cokeromyces recurvatus]KAI7899278.1 ClpP/crotonase-like domain-containing protein [Cokeromyces recurvatus]